jgi:putative transcriptional regulator
MLPQDSASLKGQFLMAMPGMLDPNFKKTVTCISEHTPEGAVGIVVNRQHGFLTAGTLFLELNIKCSAKAGSLPIHVGGPVHMDEIFILHGPPLKWMGSYRINDSLALSNTRDILEALAENRGPDAAIITLGCAGWGPGQLESEIITNTWLTGALSSDILFEVSVENRWESAVKKLGVDPALLSKTAGHA